MKRNKKYSKGITIVSLVITIILLLILAGISLQAFTGSGLFGQAIKAKEQAKLAELEEHLKLTLTEMIAQKNGEKVTIDEYIKYLKEIENINITDEYEENGKYIIEVDDKYVFEISDKDTYISIDKEGLKEDLAPKIVLESITNTTNSISVQVSTKRNEGGKIEYYIKAEDEEEYTLKEKTKDTNHTYTGLTQNKKYNVKIVAVAKNGLTAEVLVDKTLGSVTDLTAANIDFTYNPNTWTNGSVKVTAALKDMTSSYTLKITDSNPVGASKSTALGWKTGSKGITVNTNKTVYAVLVDNEGQIGAAASGNVDKIDTKIPVASVSSTTTNSITFTGSDTAKTGESASGIAGYIVQESSTAPSADDSRWTSYNGTSTTVSGLTQGKTYNVFVKDNAGNVSAAASKGTGTVTNLTSANITFTYSPSSWTNGSVKVTAALKDMTSSYTLKITDSNPVGASKQTALGWTNASTGITVSTNKTVYAVLIDNEGQIGAAASGNVDKIDTQNPVASVSSTTTNSITFTGTDTAKTGESASGIAAYIVQQSSTAPAANSTSWTSYNGTSKTVSGLTQGKTYYVFVKDKAGNVSAAASKGTGSVTISKGNITSSVKSWNGTTATVQFTTSTGYYIQTKVGNGNWSANSATTGTATANTTSGTIVYARLTDSTGQYNNGDVASITPVLTYTIAFNSNGGSGSMSSLTSRSYGTTYTLTANSFTKSGYHFKSWNTKSDGSGTTYSNQASVSNLTTTNGATVTLYAIWEQHNYTSTVTTEATCTTTGTRKYTCTSCGNSYTETIAALGHSGGTAATCTAAQTCTRCGVTIANALGHVGNEGGTVTQYTSCTNDGYRYYRCTRCHQDYGGTYIYEYAPGHSWGAGDVRSWETCGYPRTNWYKCTRCGTQPGGNMFYESAQPLGHYCSNPNYAYNTSYHIYGYCDRCSCEMMGPTSPGFVYHSFSKAVQYTGNGVHGGRSGYYYYYCNGCSYGYNSDWFDDRIGHDLNAAIYNGVSSSTGHQYTRACLACWNLGLGVVNNEGIAIHQNHFDNDGDGKCDFCKWTL